MCITCLIFVITIGIGVHPELRSDVYVVFSNPDTGTERKMIAFKAFSEVERSLMVRWVVGSILHGVDPLSYFSFQPVLHDWCNKGHRMCYPVCGMVHIKEPLLLIGKSSLCGGCGFPFSLSEWSLTICLTPYNCRAFAHGAMGRRIDPSWGGPIELFLVPASAPRLF